MEDQKQRQEQSKKPEFRYNKSGKLLGRFVAGAAVVLGLGGGVVALNPGIDKDPSVSVAPEVEETSNALQITKAKTEMEKAKIENGGVLPVETVDTTPEAQVQTVEVTALPDNGPWQMARSVAPHADQATMNAMVDQIEAADSLDGQDGLQVGEKIQVELPSNQEEQPK